MVCKKTYTLNTGAKIPAVGLGTWQSPEEECYHAVLTALKNGYKHIDTARIYCNEEAVGRAINDYLKESGTPREELFITTKLWLTESKDPVKALKTSLKRLQLDYVDLYLTHWPVTLNQSSDFTDDSQVFPKDSEGKIEVLEDSDEWNYIKVFHGMEQLVPLGLTKAIGVSNWTIKLLEELSNTPEVKTVPACNQVEIHPLLPQEELIKYCKSKNILVECYSPLGSTGAPVLQSETLAELAKKYDTTPANVALSWGVSRDCVILPKSVHEERIMDNISNIIELDAADIAKITEAAANKEKRVVNPSFAPTLFK